MKALFSCLLHMNIAAGWLILAVIIIRFILRKFPKSMTYLMYGIIGLRLCIPFFFHSMFSYFPTIEHFTEQVFRLQYQMKESETGVYHAFVSSKPYSFIQCLERFYDEYYVIFVGIWLLGMLILCLYSLNFYKKTYAKLDASVLIKDNIYACDYIESPFIMGILKPQIYLPTTLDNQYIDAILLHENTHIKRWDPFFKTLAYILVIIHWFNPLVWLAYRLFEIDLEMGCDEIVIMDMQIEDKKEYCKILLAMSCTHAYSVLDTPLAFGEVAVTQRIKNVAIHEKMSLLQPSLFIIVSVILLLVSFSKPLDSKEMIRISNGDTVKDYNIYSLQFKPSKVRLFDADQGIYYFDGYTDSISKIMSFIKENERNYYLIDSFIFIGEKGESISIPRESVNEYSVHLKKEQDSVTLLYYDYRAFNIFAEIPDLVEIQISYYE